MWMRASPHLRRTARYGFLFAALLGLGMGFVIVVGSSMGDCPPGPGCHDHDGARIGSSLLRAAPIVLVFAAGASLLLSAVHGFLSERLSPAALNLLMAVLTLALVSMSFGPAFELFLRWAT